MTVISGVATELTSLSIRSFTKKKRHCLACGKQVTVYGNNKRKYCSHECYIQHRFRHRTPVAQAE